MTNWITISKETFIQKLGEVNEESYLELDYNPREKCTTYYVNNIPVLQKVKYYTGYGYYENKLKEEL